MASAPGETLTAPQGRPVGPAVPDYASRDSSDPQRTYVPLESPLEGGGMAGKRLLIIANDLICERRTELPDDVRQQVREADEVDVVAPMLTSTLQSWVSDIDGASLKADERLQTIVGEIRASGQGATRGKIGDENELHAVEDALAEFPADALILAVHAPDVANWHERGLGDLVRARYDLPVTEILLDRDGRVLSVARSSGAGSGADGTSRGTTRSSSPGLRVT